MALLNVMVLNTLRLKNVHRQIPAQCSRIFSSLYYSLELLHTQVTFIFITSSLAHDLFIDLAVD